MSEQNETDETSVVEEQTSNLEPPLEANEGEQISGELPMVVHLKGYEDYFSEFSWDAKKVMEILGIKRSRLNQISGEELRVGKARIDRYLRPIYRPEDVKKYLEWTKPTASHKRSTSIIDEAREKLDKTSDNLKESLIGGQERLKEEFESIVGKGSRRVTQNTEAIHSSYFQKTLAVLENSSKLSLYEMKENKKYREKTLSLLDGVGKLEETFLKTTENLIKQQESLLEETKKLHEKLKTLEDNKSSLEKRFEEVSSKLKALQKKKDPSQNEQKSLRFHSSPWKQNPLPKKTRQGPSIFEQKKRTLI